MPEELKRGDYMRWKVRMLGIMIVMLVIVGCVSQASGDWIESKRGNIRKTVQAGNLVITSLSYVLYSNEKVSNFSGKRLLILDFNAGNIGRETEHYPDKFVLVLSNGRQIEPAAEQIKSKIKAIEKRYIDTREEDIFPGARVNFSVEFLVPDDFDIETTNIYTKYGNQTQQFR